MGKMIKELNDRLTHTTPDRRLAINQVSSVYRDDSLNKPKTFNKCRRVKAKLRRFLLETFPAILVVGIIFGVVMTSCYAIQKEDLDSQDRKNKLHFDEWQKGIDKNQLQLDLRQLELAEKERSFNQRVANFEDVITLSPIYLGDKNSENFLKLIKKQTQPTSEK